MGQTQSRGGDYRDNFGHKTSSPPSSSSYNPSSSSSQAHMNAFSPGAASPSSHLYDVNNDHNPHLSSQVNTSSRSPAPFPLVERYDSKTGRRLKEPVRRGYPHQHPPLGTNEHTRAWPWHNPNSPTLLLTLTLPNPTLLFNLTLYKPSLTLTLLTLPDSIYCCSVFAPIFLLNYS